jgi:hypothetical protein
MIVLCSVADPNPDLSDRCVFGLLDPDPFIRGLWPDPSIIKQNNIYKNLDSYCFVTFLKFKGTVSRDFLLLVFS